GLALCKAILDRQIVALDIPKLAHTLRKRTISTGLENRGPQRYCKEPDSPDLALLRARRERPCGSRAAEQRDELAPVHVWMAPAWQEKIERAAQKSLAVMCPACSRSPDGLLALMGSANRGLITRAGSMSR